MCGRFAFYSPAEAAAALFGVEGAPPLESRYNIAPTQDVAAIRQDGDGHRELVQLRWGLVPFWAKEKSIGNRMINARAETVAEKPAYRAAYRKRRCLILADGFYEWKKEGSGKTPWYICAEDGDPIAFAGLWESWRDRESDETLETATILTTAADRFMAELHHRMPVVLRQAGADRWLGMDEVDPSGLAADAPPLAAWPVSRAVNNPANQGPGLIEPAGRE